MLLLELMFKLFFTIGLGYFLAKKGMLQEETNRALTNLIIYVTCPALIIYSVCQEMSGDKGDITRLLVFGFFMYAFLILFSKMVSILLKKDTKIRSCYEMLLVFGNVSFIGVPILQTLYGNQAVFYNSVLHMPFNLLIFTYGIYLMNKGEMGCEKVAWKQIINPGTLASIMALGIYFSPVHPPEFIVETLGFVGNLTAALSLLVLGSILSFYPIEVMKQDAMMLVLTLVKLILIPLLFLFPAIILFHQSDMAGTIVISLAMPSASLCVMMCTMHADKIKTMVTGVVMTTIVSLITIPAFYIFLQKI